MWNKYAFLTLLSLATSVGFANPDSSEPTFEPFAAKIIGSKVRMRVHPSTDAFIVQEIEAGDLFAATGQKDGFIAVEAPKTIKGYVFRTYVLDGAIEGSHVNVRLFPDLEAPAVAQLNTGDVVQARPCENNPKWLEIDLPAQTRFYIAQEFCEKAGPVTLVQQMHERKNEAHHKLSALCLYAQAEIRKPVPQIDLDNMMTRFRQFSREFSDFPSLVSRAEEVDRLLHEVYIQKKLAFLEQKSGQPNVSGSVSPEIVSRLADLGVSLQPTAHIAQAAVDLVGCATTAQAKDLTDKMLMWEPIEQAFHHLWAATHPGEDMTSFYQSQSEEAQILSGMVELYNRPVKNMPGDYVLRVDHHATAFLYSTKVNLENYVGKNVILRVSPRPNNHFAFPAYFVLAVE